VSVGGPLAYAGIYLAAILEGEVVFIAAAVLVAAGKLDTLGVMLFGALGAATGDQLCFYALRGRVAGWLTRFRPVAARQAAIVTRVRRHQSLMIFAIRFAPGLRIAITAACAYGGVPPLRFSVLNLLAAFAWAAALLTIVSRIGPNALQHAGVSGIWGALVSGLLLILFGWWLGRGLNPESPNH
jgi:membrane protein DedA with SNARE-associated domain